MRDLSDDLYPMFISLSFEACRHGGDLVVEPGECLKLVFH